MSFTEEQMNLIKQAYSCLEKVAEEVPIETEGADVEMFWKAFMMLTVIADN